MFFHPLLLRNPSKLSPHFSFFVRTCDSCCKFSADVNIADNEGRTPLHEAAGEGYVFVTKYLIEQGADKTALDKNGMAPADCTSDEHILVCFRKVSRKRVSRSVSHAALQFVQTTATTLGSRIWSERLLLASADHRLHFGAALSRLDGAITLLSSLAIYFVEGSRATRPELVQRTEIDLHAADAAMGAFNFEDYNCS